MKIAKHHPAVVTSMIDVTCTEYSDVVQVDIQDQVAQKGKKVLYVNVGGVTVCRVSGIEEIEYQGSLRLACQLALDFHSGRPWSDDQFQRWEDATGSNEVSAGVLHATIERLMNVS